MRISCASCLLLGRSNANISFSPETVAVLAGVIHPNRSLSPICNSK
ncbi:hypothetical protein VC4260B_13330 [Vibrio cholerae 4260B]|uniref:Uncharacterized protein n=1 Tax=Vibrio cholerae (strain MO10) TaxID=345072 RepID=A0A0X1KXE1_VIBCO|nr:hypothetical protein ASZ80_01695 [Vibrio cholerae]EAZ77845.1 hypothetical protein A5E_1997 [Vibrio cholerae B33]EET22932.1 conserved hypothetical protein [Vibrio cholerae MO10]EKG51105.1 hypothetical protein VCHC41A1_1799 [Vibrio cholerae HC-41A1]EKG68367.1 hypothetical protein VCCP103710_2186 [Vibrio cholerae CP1037(10)]ELP50337.1 hypothetical protein VC4260B_13330 [Vibrio cholerae 4260B]EMB02137.1 Hypothetical protein B839_19570 [Vibrio cholerae O1 str. Inaba G4222]BAP03129.1 hypothetic